MQELKRLKFTNTEGEVNMKTFKYEVCGLTRELPYVAIKEDLAYASFVVIGDTELIQAAAKELAKQLADIDYIMTAEAKGIALAYEISRLLNHKSFIVARKSVKSYMKNVVSEKVNSITTTSEQTLYLDEAEVAKIAGKKVCLIDDVISTGESLAALERLAEKAKANVVKKAAILAEGGAANREDILFLKKLPLFEVTKDGNYIELA